jgi:transposase
MSVGNDGDFAPGVRRRRSWTRDEKRRIVAESLEDGASIAEVARRHELNANLLFTWRRKLGVEPSEQNAPMGIVPVTVAPELAAEGHYPAAAGQMEIVLLEGARITVWADVDTAALKRVLQALSQR